MQAFTKQVVEPVAQLLCFPQILGSREGAWRVLRELGEPAPLHFRVTAEALYFEMASFHGECLKTAQTGRLSTVVRAIERLAAAYEAGLLHGDLKTEHIFTRRDGSVCWLDWDFVIPRADGERGEWGIGTPGFMAPEKIRDGVTNVATEIFALGKIILEQKEASESLSIRRIAVACTHDRPSGRPASFRELAAQLQALL